MYLNNRHLKRKIIFNNETKFEFNADMNEHVKRFWSGRTSSILSPYKLLRVDREINFSSIYGFKVLAGWASCRMPPLIAKRTSNEESVLVETITDFGEGDNERGTRGVSGY